MTSVQLRGPERISVRPPDLPPWLLAHLAPAREAGEPLASRAAARLADLLLWCTALLGAAALGVSGLSLAMGAQPLVVRSGSMEPAIPVGSVAVVLPVAAEELAVGDVVWAATTSSGKALHRIISLEAAGDAVAVRAQGDANEHPDAGVAVVREVPRLRWVIPGLGYTAELARSAVGGALVTLLLLGPRLLRRS